MRVLITGATGFLGRHIAVALEEAGHDVVTVSRRASATPEAAVLLDFTKVRASAEWMPHLIGIDAVVNAVGILRETPTQKFRAVHIEAPCALFSACSAAGVRRVIQISALGADGEATSAYHLSKRAADEHLLALPVDATIVQPSLVFGPGGASARLFCAWATLPVLPLPGEGDQRVQPIHVDDAVAAIVALLKPNCHTGCRVALVGPEPLTVRQFLDGLRHALGLPPARAWAIPISVVRRMAACTGHIRGSLLDSATLSMLERGNTAPVRDTVDLLGRQPHPADRFVTGDATAARAAAILAWTLPLLRWSVALVWIMTGVLSLGVFPVDQSQALLARLGLHGVVADAMLYGAAGLDLLLGLATLAPRRPRFLWAAQAFLILGYTALITLWLPEFWLHPFGPILKNVPMLAAIAMLAALEERRPWTTS